MKLRFLPRHLSPAAVMLLAAVVGLNSPAVGQSNPDSPRPRATPPAREGGSRERPERPEREPGERERGERPPQPFGGRPGGIFNDSTLTEDQRQALRDAMESVGYEMRYTGERMMKARQALQEAIYADKPDQDKIRKHAAEIGKLEGDAAVLRAEAFAKVRPVLKPDQLERFKASFGGMGPRPEMRDGQRPVSPEQFRGPRPDGDNPDRRPGPPDEPQRRPSGSNDGDLKRPRPDSDDTPPAPRKGNSKQSF